MRSRHSRICTVAPAPRRASTAWWCSASCKATPFTCRPGTRQSKPRPPRCCTPPTRRESWGGATGLLSSPGQSEGQETPEPPAHQPSAPTTRAPGLLVSTKQHQCHQAQCPRAAHTSARAGQPAARAGAAGQEPNPQLRGPTACWPAVVPLTSGSQAPHLARAPSPAGTVCPWRSGRPDDSPPGACRPLGPQPGLRGLPPTPGR